MVEIEAVAVGGPGDGRRYMVRTGPNFTLRIFNSGPMRGNAVSAKLHILDKTSYVDYDLAEFGTPGGGSVWLLKPMGSTLVNMMNLLQACYVGVERARFAQDHSRLQEGAMKHVIGLLRECSPVIDDSELGMDLHSRLETFFAAYDKGQRQIEDLTISAPGALR